MAILIPRKNIYESSNDAVVDKEIGKVNSTVNHYTGEETKLLEISEELFSVDNAGLLNQNLSYSIKEKENIGYFVTHLGNNTASAIAEIKIKSEDFIGIDDKKTITINIWGTYRIGYDSPNNSKIVLSSISEELQVSKTIELPIDTTPITKELVYYRDGYLGVTCWRNTPDSREIKKEVSLFISIDCFRNVGTSVENKNAIIIPKIDLSISGTVFKKSETEKTSIEDSTKGSFQIPTNELLIDTTTINGTPAFDYLSQNIISNYKNGKELVEFLCSIDDYYEYDESAVGNKGRKVISTTTSGLNMHFNIGDSIIPMVLRPNAQGMLVDSPISRYADGTPKMFRIVSVKFIYDGAVWQRIIGQEIAQEVAKNI